MYHKENDFLEFEDFYVPFSGTLDKNNRWVKMAKMVPWNKFEDMYANKFKNSNRKGIIPLTVRVALGALLIQEKFGLTDRETVNQIAENPYLQYFLGFKEFTSEKSFDASMMVHFRKRLDFGTVKKITDIMFFDDDDNDGANSSGDGIVDNNENKSEMNEPKPNSGVLIADATCVPSDIAYPTDINLLSQAREKSEKILDTLFQPLIGKNIKPRTYRIKANREAKSILKSPGKRRGKNLRKHIRKQLGYLGRNLKHITKLLKKTSMELLSKKQKKDLSVIQKLYEQQKYMFENRTHRVKNRIVNIAQDFVRAIKRGKAAAPVEFGAKITVSITNGFARIFDMSWDNINEGTLLIPMIEEYHQKYNCYPKVVLVDKLFRNKKNIKYCKERDIRISGKALGKPKVEPKTKEQIKIEKQDEKDRNAIESLFGIGKRRYKLNLNMSKLKPTSETTIAISILLLNIEKRMRDVFLRPIFISLKQSFFSLFFKRIIIKSLNLICKK